MAAKRSKTPKRRETAPSTPSTSPSAPPELVVIAAPEAGLRASANRMESTTGADTTSLANALADEGVTLRPLFGFPEERMRMMADAVAAVDATVPDLSRFYQVDAPPERLNAVAKRLRDDPMVEAVYIKPPAEPAQINDMLPAADEAPPASPDFSGQQGYLNAAPGGIDARFAWTKSGGGGAGVRIIDVEGAWRFDHEDLTGNQGGMVGGVASTDPAWRNHGTAVIGEFSGDRNSFGVTGICPDANVRAVSIFTSQTAASSSAAIVNAANLLSAGDILLIELHRPGPRFNFAQRSDQRGYIAVEWWPDDLAAIRFAVAKGIIVVEAAGNGAENLDDAIYNTRPSNFPASWVNPFRRNPVDSGAIVVGAGAPPSGAFGADRSRLGFSNFGALIDAQGWGREVVTCGYGDLQGGSNERLWYTRTFSGTSSASPIVVGAIGCLQGMVRAAGKPVLKPAQVRTHLRATGSAQQNGPNGTTAQRIGKRPDLRALHAAVFPSKGKEIKEIKEKDLKDIKEKDLKDSKEKDLKDIKEKELKEKDKDLKDKEKDLKDKEKDLKDKDKDLKDKDLKDKDKDLKDKDKDLKDKDKDLKDKDKDLKELEKLIREFDKPIENAADAPGGTLASRVASLEQSIQSLTHFITSELRPDLSSSAFSGEQDVQRAQALSAELQKQASDAKALKDDKDVEKSRDF